jgi:hypothetical protein
MTYVPPRTRSRLPCGSCRHNSTLLGAAILALPFVVHAVAPPAPTAVVVVVAGPSSAAPTPAVASPVQTPTPTPAVPSPAVTPTAGTARDPLVRWGTGWYPIHVQGPVCERYVRFGFVGYGPEWDEVASTDDIRSAAQGPGPTRAHAPEAASATLDPQVRVRPHMALSAEWHGGWYPVHVREVASDGRVRIRYDGYGGEDDETVTRARLRRRTDETATTGAPGAIDATQAPAATAATPLRAGQSLFVRSGSSWYAARVLALECGSLVRIRYAGWGAEWDETVPRDRVRLPQ